MPKARSNLQLDLHQPYEAGAIDIKNSLEKFAKNDICKKYPNLLVKMQEPLFNLQGAQASKAQNYTSAMQFKAIDELAKGWRAAVKDLDAQHATALQNAAPADKSALKKEQKKEHDDLVKLVGEVHGEFLATLANNKEWRHKKARDAMLAMGTGDSKYSLLKGKISENETMPDISEKNTRKTDEEDEKILEMMNHFHSERSGVDYKISKKDGKEVFTAVYPSAYSGDKPDSGEETAHNANFRNKRTSSQGVLTDFLTMAEAKNYTTLNINTKNNASLEREVLIEMYINQKLQQEKQSGTFDASRQDALRYPLKTMSLNGSNDYKNYDYEQLSKKYKGLDYTKIEKMGEQVIEQRMADAKGLQKSLASQTKAIVAEDNKGFKQKFIEKVTSQAKVNMVPAEPEAVQATKR